MPASTAHLITNFARIESGYLDHQRENPDPAAADTLRRILTDTRKAVVKKVTDEAKKAGVTLSPDDMDERTAQRIWDEVIAKAVEAGVQTSIPGTRGNEYRKAAQKDDTTVTA